MTSNMRQVLEQQNQLRTHPWGHIVPERWASVEQYAGERVLDVGCANGVYTAKLRDRGHIAIGLDLLTYPEWHEAGNIFCLSDARNLPIPDKAFDTVISFETLEHVPDPKLALKEYYRVCKDNIIISVPNCALFPEFERSNLAFYHWTDRTHVNFFTEETLVDLISDAGFKVIEVKRFKLASPLILAFVALGMPLRAAAILARYAQRITLRRYPMSLLVIAEKREG